jgi:hypothetical protein
MFENMVICMEILLSLDICVKYAQHVKIWLFLKCAQFSEVLCSVSSEAKGRCTYRMHVSHLSKGRRVLWRHVSLLLNMHKKSLQIILHGNAPCANTQHESKISCYMLHTYRMHVCVPMVTLQARCKKHCVEHKLSEIFEARKLPWV